MRWAVLAMALVATVARAAAPPVTVRELSPRDVNGTGLSGRGTDEDIVLRKNGFVLRFARRLAGAVWRMDWEDHTLVPELDGNGGSLQTALAFDIPPGESPEVENPTEAGNYKDNYGRTTSRWLAAAGSDREAYTRSQMAYYYPPGDRVASSPFRTRARGFRGAEVSDVVLAKRVRVGWKYRNVVNWTIRLEWSERHWFTQVQILAVYLDRAFRRAYVVESGRAVRVSATSFGVSPPETSRPIILAKSRDVAVGLYAHTVPKRGRFKVPWQPWYTMDTRLSGHRDFGRGLEVVRLTGISAVWHAGDPEDPSARIDKVATFGCALVVGSVDEVAATIQRLSDAIAAF